jgi:hypothetical protein
MRPTNLETPIWRIVSISAFTKGPALYETSRRICDFTGEAAFYLAGISPPNKKMLSVSSVSVVKTYFGQG